MGNKDLENTETTLVANRNKLQTGSGVRGAVVYPDGHREYQEPRAEHTNPVNRPTKKIGSNLALMLLGLGFCIGIGNTVLAQEPELNSNQTEYAKYTEKFEGSREWVYDDATGKRLFPGNKDIGNRTIGVGFNMERAGAKEDFEKLVPEVSFKDVYNGKTNLTKEQLTKLFSQDIQATVNTARGYFPNFDSYSLDFRKALVDGCYRGDLRGSPKTRDLINRGEFAKAAIEYVDNNEYKHAIENNMGGVRKRMDAIRAQMNIQGYKTRNKK